MKDKLKSFVEKNKRIMYASIVVALAIYFVIGAKTIPMLLVCVVLLVCALGINQGGYCSIRSQDLSAVSASRFISATW